jgi:hypothetical protein
VNREGRLLWADEDSDGVVEVSDVAAGRVSFAVLLYMCDVENTYPTRFARRWSTPMSSALRPRLGVSPMSVGVAIVRPGSIFAGVVVLERSGGVSR